MKKFRVLTILTALSLLVAPCAGIRAFAAEEAEEKEALLRFNAEENFSDLGSPFWNYYHINADPDAVMKKLSVHGGDPQGDYAYDGSWVSKYKYVVDSRDFISDDYHQYLSVWGGITMHPGNKADVILSFVAPVDGVIDVTATIKAAKEGSDGVKLYTTCNSLDLEDKIYPADADYILHTNAGATEYSLQNFEVKRGDEIFFRLNKNETLANDVTYFSPTVTYSSYAMPDNVSIVIGAESLTIPEGGIRLLEAEMNVNLGQSLRYEYVSSDESVVKVKDNGLVYALKAGTAAITVTEKGSGYAAKCAVTVVKEEKKKGDGGCNGAIGGTAIAFGALAAAVTAILAIKIKRKEK